MPLFIDLHIDHTLTPELIKKCHVADKAIQAKYGVRYVQILLNQPQGYLFCLIEGPDKESCEKVHQEAHGNIACNILEITETDFSALLANRKKDSTDFTLNRDGTIDTGLRALLAINLVGQPETCRAAKEVIRNILHQQDAHAAESFENRLTIIFDTPASAIDTGIMIQNQMKEYGIAVELRMAVNVGSPLEAQGSFFEAVRKSVDHLSFIAQPGQVIIPAKVIETYPGDITTLQSFMRVLSPADEKFLSVVMECLEKVWDRENTTIPDFAQEIGMSKSQLTRKLNALTGLSPNDFIKEYKLRKALALMEDQNLNVAETTLAVGFSNPSYFTKCFRKRFGKAPSGFVSVS